MAKLAKPLLALGLSVMFIVAIAAWANDKPSRHYPKETLQAKSAQETPQSQRNLIQLLVEPGKENEARQYYAKIEQDNELGLDLGDFPDGNEQRSTLDDMLKYTGYQLADGRGLKAQDVEVIASDVLMDLTKLQAHFAATGRDPSELDGLIGYDVLASRWFAPKITDVSVPDEFIQFGWRKLVRFKPLAGSAAQTKGVGGMYMLFNVFTTRDQLRAGSPFAQRSKNNQVILTRGNDGSGLTQAAYFLVFGPLDAANIKLPQKVPGEIIFTLNASFDFRHPTAAGPGQDLQLYFVPRACAQCHGAEIDPAKGKLNYLDTDHWFDRVGAADDFPFINQTNHGVLFDGGKDEGSAEFAAAFDVVRKLNKEVEAQNEAADPGVGNFALRSVKTWLALHASSTEHVGILDDLDRDGFLDRSIVGDAGSVGADNRWRKNDRLDEALLPLLNRYCYRCHSSVRYSIYDRSRVRFWSGPTLQRFMQGYVTTPKPVVPFMPQDRVLPADVRNRFVDLLDRLID